MPKQEIAPVREQASKDISKAADANNALEAFTGAVKALTNESPEIMTGILAAVLPPSLVPVRLFHAAAKNNFLKQLMIEAEALRKKGQINEEYLKSDQAWACFSDVLDAIDKTSPDPKRFEAIREAFMRTLGRGEKGVHAAHAQQILRMVCELSSGEIVVLATVYKMGSGGRVIASHWANDVANRSGLLREELVFEIESALLKKRLLLPRNKDNEYIPDGGWGQRNRLTILGQEICELIQRPQGDKE